MTYKVTYRVAGYRDRIDGELKVKQMSEYVSGHSYAGAEEKVKESPTFLSMMYQGKSPNIIKIEAKWGNFKKKLKESRIEQGARQRQIYTQINEFVF